MAVLIIKGVLTTAGPPGGEGHARGAKTGEGEAAADGADVAGRVHNERDHAGRCGPVGAGRPAADPRSHLCHAGPLDPPPHWRPPLEGLPPVFPGTEL